MFTGIIEEIGRVVKVVPAGTGARVEVAASRVLEDAKDGDSISTDGVCLTVTRFNEASFEADCSAETLRRTTCGSWKAGTPVNLERALTLGTRLGGHLVQGHVEGVGELISKRPEGESVMMRFGFPPELGRYIALKGSIAVSGISLTVANLGDTWFEVAVIPVTLQWTTLGALPQGAPVNLETDISAKYVERLLGSAGQKSAPRTVEALKDMGY